VHFSLDPVFASVQYSFLFLHSHIKPVLSPGEAVRYLPIALPEAGTVHRLVTIRPDQQGRLLKQNVGVAGGRTEDVLGIILSASTAEIIVTHLSSIVLLFSLLVFVFFFSLYPVSFPPPSISTVINAFHSLLLHFVMLYHHTKKGTPNGHGPHLVSCI
jgi:hypothetical protein